MYYNSRQKTTRKSDIWDTMKRSNLQKLGIEESKETQVEGTGNIFIKIIEENFPKLNQEVPMKLQEANTKQTRTKKKLPMAHNNENTNCTEERLQEKKTNNI